MISRFLPKVSSHPLFVPKITFWDASGNSIVHVSPVKRHNKPRLATVGDACARRRYGCPGGVADQHDSQDSDTTECPVVSAKSSCKGMPQQFNL